MKAIAPGGYGYMILATTKMLNTKKVKCVSHRCIPIQLNKKSYLISFIGAL